MSARDKLRKSALASRSLESKIVKFGDDEYEVRQSTIGQQNRIAKQSGMGTKEQILDMNEWQFALMLNCVYVPGTDEHVFEAADKDAFLNQPPGGLFDQLLKVCYDMQAVAPEKAAKN